MAGLSSLYHAWRGSPPAAAPERVISCPVCRAAAPLLDTVDLNKSCEEARGLRLPASGTPVRYHLCDRCGFCFAPELFAWSFAQFEEKIYNADYVKVDPDYLRDRPIANAALVDQLFGKAKVTHLDYGGGSGLLSETLRQKGWSSRSYDPFVDRTVRVEDLGRFDLVTAFEVFEHVPDIERLFADLQSLVNADGVILFSTLLSDGQIRRDQPMSWWYASPRNGHISLFSKESLRLCMNRSGFNSASANANLHLGYRKVPPWAASLLGAG
jgi:SAM-dependent methyltransferase